MLLAKVAVPPGHPLVEHARDHDNLVLTPHVGGYARRALHDSRRFVAARLATCLTGDTDPEAP